MESSTACMRLPRDAARPITYRVNAVPIGSWLLTWMIGTCRGSSGTTAAGIGVAALTARVSAFRIRGRWSSMLAISFSSVSYFSVSAASRVVPASDALVIRATSSAALVARVVSKARLCAFMVDLTTGRPETPGGIRPNAARSGASSALMVRIEASALAGIVTSDNSQISVFFRSKPPAFRLWRPSGRIRNPMETPVRRPALIDCQAASIRSFSGPGSSMVGSVASNVIHSAVGV